MKCPNCNWNIPEAKRSTQANKYYWAVVLKTLGDKTGYDINACHELMKHKFLQRELMVIGDEKIEVSSTRKLSKEEHLKYCRNIELWMNSLGFYLPA